MRIPEAVRASGLARLRTSLAAGLSCRRRRWPHRPPGRSCLRQWRRTRAQRRSAKAAIAARRLSRMRKQKKENRELRISGSNPLQGALFVRPHVADDQECQKYGHFGDAEPSKL